MSATLIRMPGMVMRGERHRNPQESHADRVFVPDRASALHACTAG
jgi:hypothetical protein